MLNVLIGITGRAGTGKDTAALYLAQQFGADVHSFAAPIKRGLTAMFSPMGLDFEQLSREEKEAVIPELGASPRQMMQTLGTEWGRDCVARDLWRRLLAAEIDVVRRRVARAGRVVHASVISDVRFEDEAQWLRDQGGLLIHLQREVPSVAEHVSELPVGVAPGDVVITNNADLDQLYRALEDAVVMFMEEAAA